MLFCALFIGLFVASAIVILGCYPLKIIFVTIVFCIFISVIKYECSVNSVVIPHRSKIEGVIISIPQHKMKSISFKFRANKVNGIRKKMLLRLSWFHHYPQLEVGDRWQFTVKLKPAHGLKNPGGFDYQQWLLRQGIVATGYVDAKALHKLLQPAQHWSWQYERQRLQRFIAANIQDQTLAAILIALTVGSRALLTADIWQVFQNSGTSHLIAISGLHVGLIAAVAYFIFSCLARCMPRLCLLIPASRIAATASILIALVYGLMAGMSLPTQRAVIMVAAVMLIELMQMSVPMWRRLLLAFLWILMIEPAALYSASFWLSFSAVGWILYGMSGYKHLGKLRQWIRLQWVVALGLMPVTLYFFHQLSLVLFFANVVAIPWVSFVIVPLCFMASLCYFISAGLARLLFIIANDSLKPLWWWLRYLTHFHVVVWHYSISSITVLFTTMLAIAIYLTPKAFPLKWLAVFFCLPFMLVRSTALNSGDVALAVLDVGQGLSVFVQTAHHDLIYDAGPKSFMGFDAGQSVVLPFMLYQHVGFLDKLMISHGDNDHIGGSYAILKRFPNTPVLTSVPNKFQYYHVTHCMAGQHWRWDGVQFKVLYPPVGMRYQGNNSSCVLWVGSGKGAILLTGDIEQPAERWLLLHQRSALRARILVVPHHGSRTSSSQEFIQAVSPRIAVISAGFYNRYHFPAKSVLQRYRDYGVKILDTSKLGAIQLKI